MIAHLSRPWRAVLLHGNVCSLVDLLCDSQSDSAENQYNCDDNRLSYY